MIPFNKPYNTGFEIKNILEVLNNRRLSGNGYFTKKCHDWFEKNYNLKKCLLTTSCTDALEMSALLSKIVPGDEVIVPSYTFVSTVNAFVLRGAVPVFVDSLDSHPCIDINKIEGLVTERTKAIIVVHYAGVACDMEKVMSIAKNKNLIVVEDAAQAIDSFFINSKGVRSRLGSIGDLATFSFHETKNISSGEGGLLVLNNSIYLDRAETIWEKGTNRLQFFRGEVDKYGWVDIGSSYLPSELISAYLYGQLTNINSIQKKRKELWDYYKSLIENSEIILDFFSLPHIPKYATNNAHMFYLISKKKSIRDNLISFFKKNNIMATFHYQSLHLSQFFKNQYKGEKLKNAEFYSERLIRLPLFVELTKEKIEFIVEKLELFITKSI